MRGDVRPCKERPGREEVKKVLGEPPFGRARLGPYSSMTTFPIDVSRTTNGASFSVTTILRPKTHQPAAPTARGDLPGRLGVGQSFRGVGGSSMRRGGAHRLAPETTAPACFASASARARSISLRCGRLPRRSSVQAALASPLLERQILGCVWAVLKSSMISGQPTHNPGFLARVKVGSHGRSTLHLKGSNRKS